MSMSLDAEGLTFYGRTLVQYNLVTTSASVRSRRQTTPTYSLSNYRETLSLWFRTGVDDGILFLIGNITSEYIIAKVSTELIISMVTTSLSLYSYKEEGYCTQLV